ncbi:lipopolysaccharide kinase [Aequorivita sp. H23M31]|uniref:Lipopolysaccharide kinase n=1 Tax=Aequorivita ciconiae TaxID=2494375 RepID=A0A410G0J1_9FLAO|nr:lipopolysaccharide kinase InaA family protein [Aequorivita sp. H23M31]QAA80765.1 lipopolysaccharide kinase [Aequorivita sp. H23M31]
MRDNFIVHPHYSNLESALKEAVQNFSEVGENVTEGQRNTIKKIKIGETYFNIKQFKTPNSFQSVVYRFLRKSKAKRSYEYALKLINLGINTPYPVAYIESFSPGLKESFYISEHLDYHFDFRDLIHNPTFKNRDEILKQFTNFTFKLHQNNINFLDHSPGNTLIVEKDNQQYEFYLIDLNRMKFEPMDFDKRMFNFRRLWLSKKMIKIMAKEYAHLYSKSFEDVYGLMSKYSRQFQLKINSKKISKRKRRKF